MRNRIASLLLVCSCVCFGQNTNIDSLLNALKAVNKMPAGYSTDTLKINTLRDLASELPDSKIDTALALGLEALQLSEKIKWDKGIGQSLNFIGGLYRGRSNYSLALEYYLKSLAICDKMEKTTKGEELNKILRNKAVVLLNIGTVFNELGDNKKSLTYYFKALPLAEKIKNKRIIAVLLGNIGNCYTDTRETDRALEYYTKALSVNREIKHEGGINSILGNIGSAYYNQGDYKKALENFLTTLPYTEKIGDNTSLSILYLNIGSIYMKTGNFAESEKLLFKSITLAEKSNFLRSLSHAHQALSMLYDTTGRPQFALTHYKKYVATRDSILNDENIKKQTESELEYEFAKKEVETKAEQDKKDALAKQEKELNESKQFWFEVACVAIIAALIIIAFFLFRRYKSKKKSSEELALKNEIIESKQKEILDSIHYAKRIQESLLPSERYIQKNLTRLNRKK